MHLQFGEWPRNESGAQRKRGTSQYSRSAHLNHLNLISCFRAEGVSAALSALNCCKRTLSGMLSTGLVLSGTRLRRVPRVFLSFTRRASSMRPAMVWYFGRPALVQISCTLFSHPTFLHPSLAVACRKRDLLTPHVLPWYSIPLRFRFYPK